LSTNRQSRRSVFSQSSVFKQKGGRTRIPHTACQLATYMRYIYGLFWQDLNPVLINIASAQVYILARHRSALTYDQQLENVYNPQTRSPAPSYTILHNMSIFAPVAPPTTKLGRYRLLSPNAGVHVSPLQLGAMSIGDK